MSSRGLPALSSDAGLSRYLTEIRKFPLLTPEDEFMFAKRLKEHGDPEAARRLVTSHLRLVAKIAMGYRGYGLPVSEIVSEGNVGLMQAVKRFDPDKGFRLATYAMWWIRASIQEYVLRSWSMVKMGTTAAQKKLFFNLRKAKSNIGAIEEGDLTPEHTAKLADQLGVTRARSHRHEPPPVGPGFLAQRAAALGIGKRMAGLAGRRHAWTRKPGWPSARSWATAMTLLTNAMDDADRARARHHPGPAAEGRTRHPGRAVAEIRRQPRTGAPDRSARVREAAGGDAAASSSPRPA